MGNANSQVESDSDVEDEEEEEEEEEVGGEESEGKGEVDGAGEGGVGDETAGQEGEDEDSEDDRVATAELGKRGSGFESNVASRPKGDDVAQNDKGQDAEKADAISTQDEEGWGASTPKERGRGRRQGNTVVEQEPEQSPWQHSSQPPLEPQESIGFSPLDSSVSPGDSLARTDSAGASEPEARHAHEGPSPSFEGGSGAAGAAESGAQGNGGHLVERHPGTLRGTGQSSGAADLVDGPQQGPGKGQPGPQDAAIASSASSHGGAGMSQSPTLDRASLEQQGVGVQPPGGSSRANATEPASGPPEGSLNLPEAVMGAEAEGLSALRGSSPERMLAAAAELSSHPFLQRRSAPCELVTEFYIIRHGQASHNVGHLIGGRSHSAPLTELGTQQAHVLGRYLSTYTNLHFDAIYSSPIARALETAYIVCQEVVQIADALQELSQGQWEQQPRKAIYLEGVLERMTAAQPDFRAPGGESQRQVEFRMVEFLNNVLYARQHVAAHSENLRSLQSAAAQKSEEAAIDDEEDEDDEGVQQLNGGLLAKEDGSSQAAPPAASIGVQLQSAPKFGGSKGSLNGVHVRLDAGATAEPGARLPGGSAWSPLKLPASPRVDGKNTYRVAVFSHGTAIRCLMRGMMAWDPHLTHKVSIDNTSVTVLKHTISKGWHLVKLNDTTHMALARGPIKHSDRS